jgi:hypothetical protein
MEIYLKRRKKMFNMDSYNVQIKKIRGINSTIGYMVAKKVILSDKKVTNSYIVIGLSVCHKKDTFDKGIGRTLAEYRAHNITEPYVIYDNTFLAKIKDQLDIFVFECQQKFPECNIILPKIKFIYPKRRFY